MPRFREALRLAQSHQVRPRPRRANTPSLPTQTLGCAPLPTLEPPLRFGVPRLTTLPVPPGVSLKPCSCLAQLPTVLKIPLTLSGLTAQGHPFFHNPNADEAMGVAPASLRPTRQHGGGESGRAHAQKAPFGLRLTCESRNSTTTFSLLHRAAISRRGQPGPHDCTYLLPKPTFLASAGPELPAREPCNATPHLRPTINHWLTQILAPLPFLVSPIAAPCLPKRARPLHFRHSSKVTETPCDCGHTPAPYGKTCWEL